jgi:hypothetical protein
LTLTGESRNKTEASVEGSEQASLAFAGESRQKAEASVDAKVEMTTSSETVIKRDQVSYKLLSMSNYSTAITSVFSQANFAVQDPRLTIGDYLPYVNEDYTKGDDIGTSTFVGVIDKLRSKDVAYLVLATLDVDPPTTDGATGLKSVVVRATVSVTDVDSGSEVASVPQYQIAGLGDTDNVAQNKALSESSQRAAREIVQRLNALDVR